jgi:hypothetical protein
MIDLSPSRTRLVVTGLAAQIRAIQVRTTQNPR